MFVRNLAIQASLLQQKHYKSTHESLSGTAFMCRIGMLVLDPAGLSGHKHNWGMSLNI